MKCRYQIDFDLSPSEFTALFIFFVFLGCSNPKKELFDEIAKQRVTVEAQEMLDAYHCTMEKEGLMAELDFLDASDEFFWVPPGYQSSLSYDSVVSIIKINAPAIKSLEYKWEYLHIYPLSPTIANFTGKLHSTIVDTNDLTTNIVMLESGTLIKRSKDWKILNGQSRIIPAE